MHLVCTLQINFLDFRACGEFISRSLRGVYTPNAPTLFHFFACAEISCVCRVCSGLKGLVYTSISGIPTGGKISVEMANITMFYVLKKLIYQNSSMHNNDKIVKLNRFIDDITGIWKGTRDDLQIWFSEVRKRSVESFGLDFTLKIEKITEYTQFLDINYKFEDGCVHTDLYKKPTDANRYLNFYSGHPRHTF